MQICPGNGMRLGLLLVLLFILACLMSLSVALNIQPVGEAGNIELERMWKRAKIRTAVSVHTIKAYVGSGSMTPIIFNLGTR